MSKIHIISLGCSKNFVDSEIMVGALLKARHKIVAKPDEAGIIIINTCSFIDEAKEETIDVILEAAAYKKKGSCKYLVVVGCLVQQYQNELIEILPEVDLFVGTGEIQNIAALIEQINGLQKLHASEPKYLYDHEAERAHLTSKHMVYVKIAEGCSNRCSYCIIPKLRGAYRSRDMNSVIAEVRTFLKRGVKEINLIAQDTTAYGSDLKSGHRLTDLLKSLDSIGARKWIRLLYTYPSSVSKELLDLVSANNSVAPYLDIPIQHISDKILGRMNRRSSSKELYRLFELIRKYYPNIFLRTTVMVGFPGEEKKEFQELLQFIKTFEFDHLGCFIFSPQGGTEAFKLEGKVRKDLSSKRRDELMQTQMEISNKRLKELVGRELEILVEKVSARHIGQAPDVDGVVRLEGKIPSSGKFALAKITSSSDYDLIGKITRIFQD